MKPKKRFYNFAQVKFLHTTPAYYVAPAPADGGKDGDDGNEDLKISNQSILRCNDSHYSF